MYEVYFESILKKTLAMRGQEIAK
jgi:hypothetical protein